MKFFQAVLFTAAALFLFFFLIPQIPLWSSDEGRYADIAAGMLQARDFVFPRFNMMPYLDKPVLAPVLTAFSFMAFGLNSFAARLPVILAALAGLAACYQFARRIFNERTAMYSAVVLLTTIGYVLVGRFAVIDMLMTLMLSLANGFLLLAFLERKPRLYLWAYTFMGLGFLTKGLIGIVLPGAIFFFFLIWTRHLSEIKNMRLGWGVLIIAAIILPWCILMQMRQSDFFDTFIIKQHFSRFATGSYGRKRPFFFFVPLFFLLMFPWALFFPAAAVQSLKQKADDVIRNKFLIVWFAVIFIFFSIPKSKLPYYILPLSMPVAILVGHWLSTTVLTKGSTRYLKVLSGIFAVLGLALTIGGPVLYLFPLKFEEAAKLKPLIWGGGVLLGLGLFTATIYLFRALLAKAVKLIAVTVYSGLVLTIIGMLIISPYQSTYSFVEVLRPHLRATDRVAVFASPDKFSDFIFYLQRRIVIAGADRGTLVDESNQLPVAEQTVWFIDTPNFVPRFRQVNENSFFYLLTSEKGFRELKEHGFDSYRIMKRDHGKILLTQAANTKVPSV